MDSVNYNTASHTAELSYRSPKQISMQEGYELATVERCVQVNIMHLNF